MQQTKPIYVMRDETGTSRTTISLVTGEEDSASVEDMYLSGVALPKSRRYNHSWALAILQNRLSLLSNTLLYIFYCVHYATTPVVYQ